MGLLFLCRTLYISKDWHVELLGALRIFQENGMEFLRFWTEAIYL